MKINEGSKVRLKSGLIAWIVEVFDPSNYLAEVLNKEGVIDRTTEIKSTDIKSVFVEREELLAEPLPVVS